MDRRESHLQAGSASRRPVAPWPVFGPEEVEAVRAVLESGKVNYWTGREVRQFEAEFAAAAGCRYGVAVSNGSVALELALYALGIGPGDEVVVTPRSFIASAMCCVLRGARPVFADVDPVSQNITADTIRAVLSPRTRAIITVHLAGWPCDMDPILELAESRGLKVIEDCAQAHGATYRGRPAGSLGHAAAFSFCQDKILTTGGEGGMLTTNDPGAWKRAWSYKDHGKDWDAAARPNRGGVFQWLHHGPGTNWRMTELQGAIGRVALGKLPGWLAARRRHAAVLDRELASWDGLRTTPPPPEVGHSYYKYYVFLRPERLRPGWTRDRIVSWLVSRGVPCGSGICPEIYRERVFAARGMAPAARCPVARQLGETSLMFPVHPTLTEEDLRGMAAEVGHVVDRATRSRVWPASRAA